MPETVALEAARVKRVVFVTRLLLQYRRPFLERARERLLAKNIELQVVYGRPSGGEAAKGDAVEIDWGKGIENRIVRIGGRELYWQPCLDLLSGADLVIVEQASKLLLNYVLLAQQLMGIRRLAFWGHGRNFQEHTASGLGEAVKRWMSRRVYWWFAYTQGSADIVQSLGFPGDRITVFQNAIDTRELTEQLKTLDNQTVEYLRRELGVESSNVCLYIGGMYSEKRLEFLLDACEAIHRQLPDFHMLFIGSGPDAELVRTRAAQHSWLHALGPKFGAEKVAYFALARLLLMPGLVGLAVLDSFALGTPMVTTDIPYHSPEIEYLKTGQNGVIVGEADNPKAYADAVVALLNDPTAYDRLLQGCRASVKQYSIENMVARFTAGVIAAVRS